MHLTTVQARLGILTSSADTLGIFWTDDVQVWLLLMKKKLSVMLRGVCVDKCRWGLKGFWGWVHCSEKTVYVYIQVKELEPCELLQEWRMGMTTAKQIPDSSLARSLARSRCFPASGLCPWLWFSSDHIKCLPLTIGLCLLAYYKTFTQ